MKNTNYNYIEIKVMMEYNCILRPIFSENTEKTPHKYGHVYNMSTCNHQHNGGYDTMNPCRTFEMNLIESMI